MDRPYAYTYPGLTEHVVMPNYRLDHVPPAEIKKHWRELWEPWLAHVPRAELYHVRHVREWLLEGTWKLWSILEVRGDLSAEVVAVVCTDVVDYPLRRVGRIRELAGRDMVHWLGLIDQLEHAFRDSGCEVVEVYGRQGWGRVLDGYGLHASVLRKELY